MLDDDEMVDNQPNANAQEGPATSPPAEPGERRWLRLALILAALLLAFGLCAGCFHELGGYGVESDFYGQYGPGARDLLAGKPYAELRSGPGYSAMLALGSLVTGDMFAFAKVLAALCLSAVGLLSFLTVRSFAPTPVALLTQALLYCALFSYSFLAENGLFFLALVATSLYFLLRERPPKKGILLVAGLFAGLSWITRYEGVVLVGAGALGLLWWDPAGLPAARRVVNGLTFLGGAALGGSPWWIASTLWHGTPAYNRGYATIAAEFYLPPAERVSISHVTQMEQRFDSLFDVLTHDPPRLLAHALQSAYEKVNLFLGDSVTFPAYALAAVGLLLLWFNQLTDQRRLLTYLLFGALLFAANAFVPYQARYYYPILPASFTLVAAALVCSWSPKDATPKSLRLERRLRMGAAIAVFAVLFAKSALQTRQYLGSEPVHLLKAAGALTERAGPGEALVVRKPHLAFLTELEYVFPAVLPDRDRFLQWLRNESGARFLYVDEPAVQENAHLRPLLTGAEVPPELTLLYRHLDPPAVLYEVR